MADMSTTCPTCGRESTLRSDIIYRYCGACGRHYDGSPRISGYEATVLWYGTLSTDEGLLVQLRSAEGIWETQLNYLGRYGWRAIMTAVHGGLVTLMVREAPSG